MMDDSPKPSKMIKSDSSASIDSQKPPKYGSTSATPNSKINRTRSTISTPNAKINKCTSSPYTNPKATNKSLSSQSPQVQEVTSLPYSIITVFISSMLIIFILILSDVDSLLSKI